jgi:hypothetical protein
MTSSPDDIPEWARQFTEALAKLPGEMQKAAHIMTAQGAFAWLYRGDLDQARIALENLPTDSLQTVAVTAAALSSLAEEITATR